MVKDPERELGKLGRNGGRAKWGNPHPSESGDALAMEGKGKNREVSLVRKRLTTTQCGRIR